MPFQSKLTHCLSSMAGRFRQLARAKVNLTLHVGAKQDDGYHPLESLVVFADIGDELIFEPASKTQLVIEGAADLPTDGRNLILRAMASVNAKPHHVQLTKTIPVSAGLGGGSANAAAVLRQFKSTLSDDAVAYQLGADVPVCVGSRTAMMTGIGEKLKPLAGLGQLSAVLVNPGVAVSTGAIFNAMDDDSRAKAPRLTLQTGSLLSRALAGVNEMQDFAIAQTPQILDVLRALAQQTSCELARMSGSGATCFGLFRSDAQAAAAAKSISTVRPEWWVRACRLGDNET